MKDKVAALESGEDRTSNDAVTGVRKAESAQNADAPTEEIEIESVDVSVATQPAIAPAPESRARKTSVPPPLPAAALRLRRAGSNPLAADLNARPRPPAPPGQYAGSALPRPIGAPPPAAGGKLPAIRPAGLDAKTAIAPETEALVAEVERLSKLMRERDAYLAELEAVYAQRSEALLAAETKLEAQSAELELRAARIAELEASRTARSLQAPAATVRDDLTRIRGIGPHYARVLANLGVTSFAAIAAWTPEECTSFARQLKVNAGRVERDQWVEQARALCEPGQRPT
jgi:predicted flap endonuclease-1-like 5' DNA nuclease